MNSEDNPTPDGLSTPPLPYAEMPQEPKPHSGLGIASFIIAIVAGLGSLVSFVIAGVLENSTPGGVDEDSMEAILVGLGFILAAGAHLFGIALGIGGLCSKDRNKLFAILGISFNTIVLLIVGGLMVIGLLMGA